jgi:beta-glucosidase
MYLDLPNSPEFPFGHGLGYTEFAFDNLTIELGSATRVKFRARNLGPTPGETTVFIFVRDLVAPIARPLLALRRFLKIALSAFEDSTFAVDLTLLDLAFLDPDFRPRVEAGEFEVLIGPSADQDKLVSARFYLDGVFDLSEPLLYGASIRTAATNSE